MYKLSFGSSTNIVISQIETSTIVPTIPIEPDKNTFDRSNISPEKERWVAPLSPQKEPPRYTLFKNQIYMERQGENEDHDEVRNDEGEGENKTETTFRFPILDTWQATT